jgi:uncharacterized alpha-E superfamily protein
MGLTVPDGALDPAAAAQRLAFERGSTSSIAGALEAARDGSRGVREALSSELWECLNATYHALPGQEASAAVRGPHPFCRWVRERAALFAGLLDGSMPRDDSWRFLVLGRSLERVDMTARLLRARAVQSGTSSDWVGLLRCCSAHEAYLRGYRAAVEPERVVEFLVLDRLFPRSVYAALAQAERCLVDLDPSAGAHRPRRRRAAAARPGPHRPGVPHERRAARRPPAAARHAPAHGLRRRGRAEQQVLPPRRRPLLDRGGRRMSWRLRVRHTTGYRYDTEVRASYNEAR